jgi:hypothetical protein
MKALTFGKACETERICYVSTKRIARVRANKRLFFIVLFYTLSCFVTNSDNISRVSVQVNINALIDLVYGKLSIDNAICVVKVSTCCAVFTATARA